MPRDPNSSFKPPRSHIDAQLTPGDHTRSFQFGDRERSFLAHVPAACDGSQPVPLLLALHGGGSNAAGMLSFSGLNDKSDQAGFIVVYPNGTGRLERALTWNAGNCCGYGMRHKVDDVGFLRTLIDRLQEANAIDPHRIFVTGMSNGAMMTYLLASQAADAIAAIAPVGGPMGTSTCAPSRPIPIIHFHGTDDEFAPFQGGRGTRSLSQAEFLPVTQTISTWVTANGCDRIPSIEEERETAPDGTRIIRKTYGNGRNGSEIVLYEIEGGGHTWPGSEPFWELLGRSTMHISANDLMWDFFQRHPL